MTYFGLTGVKTRVIFFYLYSTAAFVVLFLLTSGFLL